MNRREHMEWLLGSAGHDARSFLGRAINIQPYESCDDETRAVTSSLVFL
jgi:hypothetical protein